ncbi:MAG: proline dehydrogenase family protein [Candidatus Sericytochromatia bacterium]
MNMNAPVDFHNTEIAFASKSNAQLRRAWLLYRMLAFPALVGMGKQATQLAFGLHLPIEPLIRNTLFEQFVGGETIAGCEDTVKGLWQYRIGSILDFSAEGLSTEAGFDATRDELLRMLDFSRQDPRIPFAVFKVTGLGRAELLAKASQWGTLSAAEQAELARVKERLDTICTAAVQAGTPVWVDAEESWLQPVIDRWVLELMQRFNGEKAWIWNTLQMYRRDRLAYLDDLLVQAKRDGFWLGFKLVRGAYMEKERAHAAAQGLPSPIQPDKAASDAAFDAAVDRCLAHLDRVAFCAGSHNEASNQRLVRALQEHGIAPNDPRVWFAQLLGMSDHISYNLARAGYNVAKYVPYAPIRELVPYLMRRAEENTSVRGQSGRELDLIQQEMRRRGLL